MGTKLQTKHTTILQVLKAHDVLFFWYMYDVKGAPYRP